MAIEINMRRSYTIKLGQEERDALLDATEAWMKTELPTVERTDGTPHPAIIDRYNHVRRFAEGLREADQHGTVKLT